MDKPLCKSLIIIMLLCITFSAQSACNNNPATQTDSLNFKTDSVVSVKTLPSEAEIIDSLTVEEKPSSGIIRLTEQDYIDVANELGVDVASIKAVVDVEAGRAHQGFWAEGKPIINFDLSIYQQAARRHKVNLAQARKAYPVIFAAPNAKKYGSQQAGQQARLDAARKVDNVSGIEGTFWGMFQLGGFNWKLCETDSPDHFVELMSRSERDQLELFAKFIKNTGLLPSLQSKNWSAFARRYNGASYAKRGYHTKLAAAYARHKK